MIVDREIGRLLGSRGAGPTLIAVCAIHGNEQAGIHAARRVLARLQKEEVAGEIVCFAGNVGAIHEHRRYRVRDLNRVWTDDNVSDIERRRNEPPPPPSSRKGTALDPFDAEEREVLGLLDAIRGAIARARGPVFLVDFHTTSAHGVPFALFGDTPNQRVFAAAFPLPVILGLEEQLKGVLSSFWTRHGCTTLAVEGGQHEDLETVDNLEAVLLVAAEAAGVLATGANPSVESGRKLLEARRADLPRVMQVISRHAITPDDAFRMEPGFRNLDYAREEQLLARDRSGEIRAPKDGVIILPLYQGQGEDGFFWGRVVDADHLAPKT